MAHPGKDATLKQDIKKLIRWISAPSNNTLTSKHQRRAPPCARRQLDDGRVFWNATASFPAVWTFPARAARLPRRRCPYFQRPCRSCSKARQPKRVSVAGLPAWSARTASSPATPSTCWTWAPSRVAGCLRTGDSTARAAPRRTWSHRERRALDSLVKHGVKHRIHCLTKIKQCECVDSNEPQWQTFFFLVYLVIL